MPVVDEIHEYITKMCEKNDIRNTLNKAQIEEMYENSRHDCNICINNVQLKLYGIQNQYDVIVKEIIKYILSKDYVRVRKCIYIIYVNNFDNVVFIKDVLNALLDIKCVHELVHVAAKYQHQILLSERPIYHLEAFVTECMTLI